MFSDGLHHALASIEYGNPFLKSETTNKFVINFEKMKEISNTILILILQLEKIIL